MRFFFSLQKKFVLKWTDKKMSIETLAATEMVGRNRKQSAATEERRIGKSGNGSYVTGGARWVARNVRY